MNQNRTNDPLLLYLFSFITVSISSGLVYGYPHFRNNLLLNDTTLSESQLGIIYTVGSWTVHGGRFFSGLARDRFGTRIIAFLSLLSATVGTIGLAFANQNDVVSLSVSFFFVGLGSGGQLCLQPVASLFPKKWQGTILASLSGAFQISGLLFLVLVKITSNRSQSYGYFAIILACFALSSLYLLPKHHFVRELVAEKVKNYDDTYEMDCEDEKDSIKINSITPEGSRHKESIDNIEMKEATDLNDETEIKLEETKAIDLIKTLEYFLLLLWFSTVLVPMQYYIGTIAFQMERKGDKDGTYTSIFSICYASAAIVSPIMGKIADIAGLGPSQLIATLLVVLSLFALLFSTSKGWWSLQIIGMTCYSIGRMTIFGMFFVNVGKRFGYTHYGMLVGLGLLISALISILQYPLIYIADRGNEFFVNLISAIVILMVGVPYCGWLTLKEKREKNK